MENAILNKLENLKISHAKIGYYTMPSHDNGFMQFVGDNQNTNQRQNTKNTILCNYIL